MKINYVTVVAIMGMVVLSSCSRDRFESGSTDRDSELSSQTVTSDQGSAVYFNQTIGDRVHFSVDQSTLSAEAVDVLSKQAMWLLENNAYSAVIEGHADEQGTREYNLALGARRASAVQNFLVERGVSQSRLQVVSYGKERPLEICSAESCYAQNRRSVTVLSAN